MNSCSALSRSCSVCSAKHWGTTGARGTAHRHSRYPTGLNILDNKPREQMGEASGGLARWIVGTPPPALIMDLLFTAQNIVGIYPQGPVGQHDFLIKFRSGYPSEKCSWVMINIINPKLIERNRPERIFQSRVKNPQGTKKRQRQRGTRPRKRKRTTWKRSRTKPRTSGRLPEPATGTSCCPSSRTSSRPCCPRSRGQHRSSVLPLPDLDASEPLNHKSPTRLIR